MRTEFTYKLICGHASTLIGGPVFTGERDERGNPIVDKLANPYYEVDKENELAVNKLAAWLAREEFPGLDLEKGIVLIGNVGSGKTILMRSLRNAMMDIWRTGFGVKPSAELTREFAEQGYDGIEKWITARHVCFDDIGTEGEAMHYGKKTMIIGEIIEARYDRAQSGLKAWTHFTSNLGPKDWEKTYGPRAASRLRHMCNMIPIGVDNNAKDRRKTARALKPGAPVNADNIYNVIHPDIWPRIKEVVDPIVDKMRVDAEEARPKREVATAEDVREVFRAKVSGFSDDLLKAYRESYLKDNPVNTTAHAEAMQYVAIIDQELKSRQAVPHGTDQ